MHPFSEGTAAAALANLDEAIETLRSATRARTDSGMWSLIGRALGQAANARAKLADALMLEEMAVTTGNEEERTAAE